MKKTFIALFSALAMVLIGCSQPTGGDIPDWENPPSEIGGGDPTDPTDPAAPEDPVTKFTVTFNAVYGENPASIEVEKDTVLTAEQLKELTFEGFIFKGWFDGETEAVAGKYKVTKDVTLKAVWEKSSSTDPDPVDPEPEDPETDPVVDPDPTEPEDPTTEPENLSEYDSLIAALTTDCIYKHVSEEENVKVIIGELKVNCTKLLIENFLIKDFIQILFNKGVLETDTGFESMQINNLLVYGRNFDDESVIVYTVGDFVITLRLPEASADRKVCICSDGNIRLSNGSICTDCEFCIFKKKGN